jgi:hypothetical protein
MSVIIKAFLLALVLSASVPLVYGEAASAGCPPDCGDRVPPP